MKKLSRLQKLFWPSLFSILVLTLFIGITKVAPKLCSYDLWWHLRTGDLLLKGLFPRADLFSYTALGAPWILHEWLSDIFFAGMFNKLGIHGLVLLKAFLIALTIGIIFKAILLRKGMNIFFAFFLALLTALGTARIWTVRPHLFSLLFFSMLIYIYYRYRATKKNSLLYTLPLLFQAWVNLHGGFILGFAFLFFAVLAELWEYLKTRSKAAFKDMGKLMLASSFAVLFSFLNPNTYKGVLYPLSYIGNKVMPSFAISEWQPASWANSKDLIIFLFFLLVIFLLNKAIIKTRDIFLVVPFLFLAVISQRMIPFAILVAIPALSIYLQQAAAHLWNEFNFTAKKKLEKYFSPLSNNLAYIENNTRDLLAFTILLLLMSLIAIPGTFNEFQGFDLKKDRYPVATVKYLKHHPRPGNVFNTYRFGGYLLYKLPQKKVFIDGRMDVYGYPVYEKYQTVLNLKKGWRRIMDRYNITQALVDKNSILDRFLPQIDRSWHKVAEDNISVLYYKN